MIRNNMRDFWLIVLLVYGILGFSYVRAQEEGLRKGLSLLNEGKIEEAIVILKEEVSSNPSVSGAHLALGVGYMEKGENSLARAHLQKAMELQPDSVPAYYTLAMLYEKEKEIEKAVMEWKKVLELSRDKDLQELARKHLNHLER